MSEVRPIDANALKEEVFKAQESLKSDNDRVWERNKGYFKGLAWANYLIDNAPTVAPCYQDTPCLDCDNYDKENHNCPRYCEVIKEAIKALEERRQQANCKACKYYHPFYKQFMNIPRGDGYCVIARTTPEGITTVNCYDSWYCADFCMKEDARGNEK